MNSSKVGFSDDYSSIFIKRLGLPNCKEIIFSVQYKMPDIVLANGIELQSFAWSGLTPFASFVEKHETGDKRVEEWYYNATKGRAYIRPN